MNKELERKLRNQSRFGFRGTGAVGTEHRQNRNRIHRIYCCYLQGSHVLIVPPPPRNCKSGHEAVVAI
jgi:hypothetical protein